MSQWNPTVGWHTWTEPTTEQRYEAIRSNAAERRPASGMPHTPAPGCTCHPTDPFEDDTEESGHAE